MTRDLSDFEQQLGEELLAAAYRRLEARDARRLTQRRIAVAATGLVVVIVLVSAALVIFWI